MADIECESYIDRDNDPIKIEIVEVPVSDPETTGTVGQDSLVSKSISLRDSKLFLEDSDVPSYKNAVTPIVVILR